MNTAHNLVSAHNVTGQFRDLVGVTGKCFNDLFKHLREGDQAVVEVEGRGSKTISIENGQRFVGRHLLYDR